jgi:hypothetical protein
VRGEFVEVSLGVVLEADGRQLAVALHDESPQQGSVEVRGQLIDVGRLEPNDPRLTGYLPPDPDRWPQRGELLLLSISNITNAELAITATPRTLALEPWKFENKSVTVTGQFRGRNLYGDLPAAPALSEHDFVLQNGGGAIWVTKLEPAGRDFNLRVTARADTGHWVEVTGIVVLTPGLVAIEGSAIKLTSPLAENITPKLTVLQAQPPATVVFSIPVRNETAVPRGLTVKLQFSRGLNPDTVDGNIRMRYTESVASSLAIETTYDSGTNSIAIALSGELLDPFRQVAVETLEGLSAFDGGPVEPFTLSFTTGP